MRAALFVIATLACVLACSDEVHAQAAQRFALNWVRGEGAESCIASHRLAAIVQNAFGPLFVAHDQADLAIEGSVARAAGAAPGFRARVVVSDRHGAVLGVRELHSASESCSALDAQIVLVVAMAIDPEAALEGLPSELLAQLGAPADSADQLLAELRAEAKPATAAPAVIEAPTPSEPAPPPKPLPPKPPPERRTLALLAQPGLSIDLLPASEPLIGLAAELQVASRVSVLAQGAWSLPSMLEIEAPSIRSASVRFDLTVLSLAACVLPLRSSSVRMHACLGPSLFLRGAEGRGLARANDSTQLDLAGLLAAGLTYSGLSPALIGLSAALHAPVRRLQFSYQIAGVPQSTELFTSPAVGFSFALSAGIELDL